MFTHRIKVFKIHYLFPSTIQSYFLLKRKTFFCFVEVCVQYWLTNKWSFDDPLFTHRIEVFKIHDLFPLTIQLYFLLNKKLSSVLLKSVFDIDWLASYHSRIHRLLIESKFLKYTTCFLKPFNHIFSSIEKLSFVSLKSVFTIDWPTSGHSTIHCLLIESKFSKYMTHFLWPFNCIFCSIEKRSSVLLKSVFDINWLTSGHLTIHRLLIELKF